MEKIKENKKVLVIILLFILSAVFHGLLSDFPKVISGYPDELRYVGIGRSLFEGQGLKLHNLNSDFQKILYSITILPAFFFRSTADQIRAIGYINSLLLASSIFPLYGLCRRILKEDKEISLVIVFWMTFPVFVFSLYFMSEVAFLPLSLWVVYCVWRIFCSEKFSEKLYLNLLLGVLCYLAYLNKEIALYYVLAYLFVYILFCVFHGLNWKNEAVCLLVFVGVFVLCFLIMKGTIFYGLENSYSNTNLKAIRLNFSIEEIRYLLYGLICNVLFTVLAFGIFPVIIPLAFWDKKEKESWFFLFLFLSLLIGCATISYLITLPEDFGKQSPRLHIRYLEPLMLPLFMLMINNAKRLKDNRQENGDRRRYKIVGICVILFAVAFICLKAGGGSYLADNSALLYYELFARFLCKSDRLLLAIRLLIAVAAAIGFIIFYRNRNLFIWLFGVIFICVNMANSAAGFFAGRYRYSIEESQRVQAAEANEYLRSLPGNILLISKEGTSPEDKRLLDTYISRELYVTDMELAESDGILEDWMIDLSREPIRCDVSGTCYTGLNTIDYLVVKDSYHIQFKDGTVEKDMDFPLDEYSLYHNLRPEIICLEQSY